MIERPKVVDGLAAVRHDDQSSLAADIVDQQLEEGVDRERLER